MADAATKLAGEDWAYERGRGSCYVCSCGATSESYATFAEVVAWADGHESWGGDNCGKPKVPGPRAGDAFHLPRVDVTRG